MALQAYSYSPVVQLEMGRRPDQENSRETPEKGAGLDGGNSALVMDFVVETNFV